jgi:hypothetical protein
MFLTTGEGVIVVDACPTIADKLLTAIGASWRDRLGGADVFTYDHAAVLADALRRDWGVGV